MLRPRASNPARSNAVCWFSTAVIRVFDAVTVRSFSRSTLTDAHGGNLARTDQCPRGQSASSSHQTDLLFDLVVRMSSSPSRFVPAGPARQWDRFGPVHDDPGETCLRLIVVEIRRILPTCGSRDWPQEAPVRRIRIDHETMAIAKQSRLATREMKFVRPLPA